MYHPLLFLSLCFPCVVPSFRSKKDWSYSFLYFDSVDILKMMLLAYELYAKRYTYQKKFCFCVRSGISTENYCPRTSFMFEFSYTKSELVVHQLPI
jgi:hypothetical protein